MTMTLICGCTFTPATPTTPEVFHACHEHERPADSRCSWCYAPTSDADDDVMLMESGNLDHLACVNQQEYEEQLAAILSGIIAQVLSVSKDYHSRPRGREHRASAIIASLEMMAAAGAK
jgi:hypothetical protein